MDMLSCSSCDRNAATRRISHDGGAVAFPVCDRKECATLLCRGAPSGAPLLLVGPRADKRRREDEESQQRLDFEPTLTGVHTDARRLILSRVPLVDLLGTAVLLNHGISASLDALDWQAIYARSIVPFFGAREDLVLRTWRSQAEAYLTSHDLYVTDGATGRIERVLPFETARDCGAIQFRVPRESATLPDSCVIHAPGRMNRRWWLADGGPLRISVTLRRERDTADLDRKDYVGPDAARANGWYGPVLARSEPYTGSGVRLLWEVSNRHDSPRLICDPLNRWMQATKILAVENSSCRMIDLRPVSGDAEPAGRTTTRPTLTIDTDQPLTEQGCDATQILDRRTGGVLMKFFKYWVSRYECFLHLPPPGTDPASVEGWRDACLGDRATVVPLPPADEANPGYERLVDLAIVEHVWFKPVWDSARDAYGLELRLASIQVKLDERFSRLPEMTEWKNAYQGDEEAALDLYVGRAVCVATFLAGNAELRKTMDRLLPLKDDLLSGLHDDRYAIPVFRTSATSLVCLTYGPEAPHPYARRGRSYNIASRLGQQQ